jgi:hypothetical protein
LSPIGSYKTSHAEDRADQDFSEEHFGDPEDDDEGEKEDMPQAGESRNTGDA